MEGVENSRIEGLLWLLHNVCQPENSSSLKSQSEINELGNLAIFRSAVLRVMTHLTSGVAGSHVAITIASIPESKYFTRTDGNNRSDECSLCLSSLLSFLSLQNRLLEENVSSTSTASALHQLDYFSHGLCFEALANLCMLASIPFVEMKYIVREIQRTLRQCDDIRVLCAASNLLGVVLSCLMPRPEHTSSSQIGCSLNTHNASISSEKRVDIMHLICCDVANDIHILSSLEHIFDFFVTSSGQSDHAGQENLVGSQDSAPVPTASSCDPSMWLLGNEFGMRTTGNACAPPGLVIVNGLFQDCWMLHLCF